MLSEQLRQLLTAYVDGELTNRQRKAAQRLLCRSSEARTLLRRLQQDSRLLHALPRQHLDDEFTARVVQAVQQGQVDARRRAAARQASFPAWAGFAAAAAVLLAVGVGSFLFFTQPPNDSPVAIHTDPSADPDPDPMPNLDPAPKDEGASAVAQTPAPPPNRASDPPKVEELPMPIVRVDPPKNPIKPEEFQAAPTPLPDMEVFKPAVVKPPFSLLEDVREIQADKLLKKLGQERALRIELPCHDTAKAFRRVQAALKEAGVTLAIDPAAQNRLDKPALRSNYVIFLEDLTADELARTLARVGSDDRKAAEVKPKPQGQFTKMVVNGLSDADRKELSDVLRVEARQLQAGSGKGKGGERLALAVTYNPERPKVNSPEVKRYLDNRKPDRTGALQVLLVLRESAR